MKEIINHNRLAVFLTVFLSVVINGVLFNCSILGGLVNIYDYDSGFVILMKVLISLSMQISVGLFIASFVFLFSKDIWFLVFGLISDLWLISNHIYYKANDLLLSVDAIALAGNLSDGKILRSVLPFLPGALLYPLVTIFSYLAIIYLNRRFPGKGEPHTFRMFVCSIMVSIVFLIPYPVKQWGIHYARLKEEKIYGKLGYKCFVPFYVVSKYYAVGDRLMGAANWGQAYLSLTSIYHYFPAALVYNASRPNDDDVIVNDSEVSPFINTTAECVKVESPLIIFLVESLESWAINGTGQLEHVADNLSRLSQSDSVLYCSQITSQVRHGVSGDGQLIVSTGLLPTYDKIVCQDYYDNCFPNYAGLFRESYIINPWPHSWNQDKVTTSYGYKSLIQSTDGTFWNDGIIIDKAIETLKRNRDKSICLLVITSSTHIPFDADERSKRRFDRSVPKTQSDYLNCLEYTDSCLARFFDYIGTDTFYSNATIVITGDHTIFKSGEIDEIMRIKGINSDNVSGESTFVPLFIRSPKIEGNMNISDKLYQMDIFPTVMHAIGADEYWWKGLGINLFQEPRKRQITSEEAEDLSDRIIRKDYLGNPSYMHLRNFSK